QQPGYPQQPGYGQQPGYASPDYGQPGPPPHGGGQAWITVDAKYHPLAFILSLFKPKIILDGQPVPNPQWGSNTIPVIPGPHHVKVVTPYLWDFGHAEIQVNAQEGQNLPVEYRSPMFTFGVDGSIGPPPQEYNGMGLYLGVLAVPLGVALIVCFLCMIGALFS
ncbi:MAG TPA: hypothetical protein H9902_08575, partial [Candidatus Stackebrandtia faecavium]|nr:hypothetical protein [Candidatus Stackebrandtia faecavium]